MPIFQTINAFVCDVYDAQSTTRNVERIRTVMCGFKKSYIERVVDYNLPAPIRTELLDQLPLLESLNADKLDDELGDLLISLRLVERKGDEHKMKLIAPVMEALKKKTFRGTSFDSAVGVNADLSAMEAEAKARRRFLEEQEEAARQEGQEARQCRTATFVPDNNIIAVSNIQDFLNKRVQRDTERTARWQSQKKTAVPNIC
jgi:hypothetical protein